MEGATVDVSMQPAESGQNEQDNPILHSAETPEQAASDAVMQEAADISQEHTDGMQAAGIAEHNADHNLPTLDHLEIEQQEDDHPKPGASVQTGQPTADSSAEASEPEDLPTNKAQDVPAQESEQSQCPMETDSTESQAMQVSSVNMLLPNLGSF